ncbi:cytochrome b N-terminal domain-containing protein [Hippea jasoniae]|uniref:cytochrome b N-terminal domain-containing protein n=1 Tax=Hippea jasoniae TaxID=944479 RepID=UPI000553715F|nr:cytochrome b N-terminal domain-containing protein [Hippea jasoniae]
MKIDYFISYLTIGLISISFFSGFALLFFYNPITPLKSVENLTLFSLGGSFFRKLHYFSSEASLILVITHIVIESIKKNPKKSINKNQYIVASFALFILILLMFTGFVIKADLSGQSAMLVAENIIKKSYLINFLLPLFKDPQNTVFRFYIMHISILPVLFTFLVLKHAKAVSLKKEFCSIALAASLILTVILKQPEDIIKIEQTKELLKGPWFFYGAENMLMFNFPVDLVVVIILFPFIILSLYPFLQNNKKILNYTLLAWVLFYGAISLV